VKNLDVWNLGIIPRIILIIDYQKPSTGTGDSNPKNQYYKIKEIFLQLQKK
jgi:hypothetical protein